MAIKATIHLDGSVTYEEFEPEIIPEDDPEPETELTVWDELDAAYQEGVDSI